MVGTCMRSSFRAARFGGANATGIAVVKSAQQEPLKIDFVDACGLATQGHGLTDKGFADGTHPALPLDLAVVADVAHNPASPVADGLRSAITSSAVPIAVGRVASAQSFMRTLGVVMPPPAVTTTLLGERVGRWRMGGVPLEFTMHLFMRTIFLRATPGRREERRQRPGRPG